jgi:hypothetical protein
MLEEPVVPVEAVVADVAVAVAVAVPDPPEVVSSLVLEPVPVPVLEEGTVQDSILNEPVQLMENFVMVLLTPAQFFPGMVPLYITGTEHHPQ